MKEYHIAFVGNPNVGKSAWINALSNSHFKVGNWPGVTIEKKEAIVTWNHTIYHLIDLPGTYALDQTTNEEQITATYLLNNPVDLIVNVVDATNLSRHLFLTLRLRELQKPMIMILNFMDEVERYHILIEVQKLSRRLQIPIYPYSAFDQPHYKNVIEAICESAGKDVAFGPICEGDLANRYVHMCTLLEQQLPLTLFVNVSMVHFFSLGIIRKDENITKQLSIMEIHIPCEIDEQEWQMSHQRIVLSLMKYVHEDIQKRLQKSRKIDHYLLHRIWGFPICFVMFSLVLMIVFNGSAPWNDFVDFMINQMLAKYIAFFLQFTPDFFQQFILKGILAGVGGVLTFVPLIALLYFMLAILEECGYMSRIAFLFDRSMRTFHLSGKSFVSLMLGFGCNVPAIYATRTLDNEKQKKLTALLVPFMSCGARLPVYMLFAAAFYQGKAAIMILTIYGIGILLALLVAFLCSFNQRFKSDGLFVLELPPYRMPSFSVVFHKVVQEVKGYVKKATTVVLWAMIIIWGFSYFPTGISEDSYMTQFAKAITPIYEPLGFGTRWETVAALPGSIVAKETVVGFLDQVLLHKEETYEEIEPIEDLKIIAYKFGSSCKKSVTNIVSQQVVDKDQSETLVSAIHGLWKDDLANARAFSYMVYILLSIPCIMTLQALGREYGMKLMLFSITIMVAIPYLASFIIFQLLALLI